MLSPAALARCNFSIGFLLSFLSWTMFRTIASPLERQGCAVSPRGAPTILCRRFVRCDVTPSFRSMKGRFRRLFEEERPAHGGTGIAERGGKCRSFAEEEKSRSRSETEAGAKVVSLITYLESLSCGLLLI